VRWAIKTDSGEAVAAHPDLDQQCLRLILARAVAMARSIKEAGATPLIFFDEPGLFALNPENPEHQVHLQELKIAVQTIRKQVSDILQLIQSETSGPGRRRREVRREPLQLEGDDLERLVLTLEEEMREAAKELRFEYAARLRDEINELRRDLKHQTVE